MGRQVDELLGRVAARLEELGQHVEFAATQSSSLEDHPRRMTINGTPVPFRAYVGRRGGWYLQAGFAWLAKGIRDPGEASRRLAEALLAAQPLEQIQILRRQQEADEKQTALAAAERCRVAGLTARAGHLGPEARVFIRLGPRELTPDLAVPAARITAQLLDDVQAMIAHYQHLVRALQAKYEE